MQKMERFHKQHQDEEKENVAEKSILIIKEGTA